MRRPSVAPVLAACVLLAAGLVGEAAPVDSASGAELTLEWRPPVDDPARASGPPTALDFVGRVRGPDPRMEAPLIPVFVLGKLSYFFVVPVNYGQERFDGWFVARVVETGAVARAGLTLSPIVGESPGLQNGFVIGGLSARSWWPSPFTLELSFELVDGTPVGQKWSHAFDVLHEEPCQDHAGLLSAFGSRDVVPNQQPASYAFFMCNERPERPTGALAFVDGATGRPFASALSGYRVVNDAFFSAASGDVRFTSSILFKAPRQGYWTGFIFGVESATPPGPVSPTLRIAWDDGVLQTYEGLDAITFRDVAPPAL